MVHALNANKLDISPETALDKAGMIPAQTVVDHKMNEQRMFVV